MGQTLDKFVDKARAAVETVKGTVGAVHGTLVGVEIAKTVESYSAVYGEILLGMHRDLEEVKAGLEEARERLQHQTRLLYVSLGISVGALFMVGYVLWMRG